MPKFVFGIEVRKVEVTDVLVEVEAETEELAHAYASEHFRNSTYDAAEHDAPFGQLRDWNFEEYECHGQVSSEKYNAQDYSIDLEMKVPEGYELPKPKKVKKQ